MKKNIAALFSAVILSLTCAAFANAQTDTDANSKQTADKPLKILNKPRARPAGCNQSSGQTKLRVTFDKSAKITKTEITQSSGCADFDNNSIKAARNIKFEPQIKDGEAITVTKQVEYNFRRF
jgi:TonB family protein